MLRSSLVIATLLLSGCNVFYGTSSPLKKAGGADCSQDCDVNCDDCSVMCAADATCNGTVEDATAVCDDDAQCELGCTGGRCEFLCTDRGANCFIDCADDAECVLECGTNRNRPQRERCVFVNCDSPATCDDGRQTCNTPCSS